MIEAGTKFGSGERISQLPSRNFNVPHEQHRWQQQLRWTPDSRSLIYVDSAPGYSNLIPLLLENGKPTPISDFKSERIFGFDISGDGKQLAFARIGEHRVNKIKKITKHKMTLFRSK